MYSQGTNAYVKLFMIQLSAGQEVIEDRLLPSNLLLPSESLVP